MAMTDLASQGPDALVALRDISARQKISLSYLEQLFRPLRQAGLVESRRGAAGGYKLSMRPSDLTLGHIIQAVDEPIKAHGCTPEARHSCTGSNERCLTHDLWGALERHIGRFMAAVTLDDVLQGRVDPTVLEAAE